MNIIVCVKQVPDVDNVKWTKENNLDRSAMLTKLNPHDEWALDYAIKIKNQFKNVSVTALTMGPNQAKEILDYALAKGATRAILLTDKLFAGSDTLATAKILSGAIKKYIPDFDLILTGQIAQDGDTAQTPASMAQLLDIKSVSNVIDIKNADKNTAIVAKKNKESIDILELSTPCLIAIQQEPKEMYMPKIEDYAQAQKNTIEVYGAQDIDLDKSEIGILGSPTMVYKAYRPEVTKNAQEIKDDFAKEVLNFIRSCANE